MEEEKWLPVVRYEGLYEVSDRGRVRSLDRIVERSDGYTVHRTGALRALRTDKKGYKCLCLYLEGSSKYVFVHRLVVRAFLGDSPGESTDVNHKDFDPANNRLENLEWVTRSENLLHSTRAGRRKRPEGRVSKFASANTEILALAESTPLTIREISEKVQASFGYVSKLVRGLPRPKRPHRPNLRVRGSAASRPERAKKLTIEQVRLMRDLYSSAGMTQTALARSFGVRQCTVSDIILGKIWCEGITSPSAPEQGL